MVEPVRIASLEDPRVARYRGLRDRELLREDGRFVAEGLHLVTRLLRSGLSCESVLVAPRKLDVVIGDVPAGVPVYVVDDALAEQIVGFRFHTGALAIGVRPRGAALQEFVRKPTDEIRGLRDVVVVCPDLSSAENLGSIARTAAALGARGMVIGPQSIDPWYRLAVRVSMGAVFTLPIVRSDDVAADLRTLREQHGYRAAATVLDGTATPLHAYQPADRSALVFGAEAYGLPPEVVEACDDRVTIPMSWGTDSLNVAVAAAVFLYAFTQPGGQSRAG